MRIVLSGVREAAHYWANQVQSEGRANSLSFNGNSLVSGKEEIARLVPEAKAVLFRVSYEHCSPTTLEHLAEARAALSKTDWPHQFAVPHVATPETDSTKTDGYGNCQNLWHYRKTYANLMLDGREIEARETLATAATYREVFNVSQDTFDRMLSSESLAAALGAARREAKRHAERQAIDTVHAARTEARRVLIRSMSAT